MRGVKWVYFSRQDTRFLINIFIMWEIDNITSNCEPQCKKYLVVIFLSLWFIVQKLYLFLLLLYLFHNRYIRALPFYGAYTQSSCRKLALDNIIERFYDFDQNRTRDCCFTNIFTWRLFPGMLQNHRVFLWWLTKNDDVIYDIDDGFGGRCLSPES